MLVTMDEIVTMDERRQQAEQALAEARDAAAIGDWPKARTAMARAIDACPNDSGFHALMGHYTLRTSALQPAERERLTLHHLNVALELDARNADAHCYLGELYQVQGNSMRARAAFEAACKAQPGHLRAREALERAGGKTPPPVTVRPGPVLAARRRRHHLPFVLAAALFLAAGGGAAYFVMAAGDDGERFTAIQLETTLEVTYAVARQGHLTLELGRASAGRLSREQLQTEIVEMAEVASRRGVTSVSVSLSPPGSSMPSFPLAEVSRGKFRFLR
jgi:tetratricopeptide (TPR) repeat protein